jgi:hypothetical protein
MKKLSGQMRTLANSVLAKAELREGMMAVVAVTVLAMSLAEILSHRKHSGSHATSTGCDADVFRRRLASTLLPYSDARDRTLLFSGE